MNFEPIVTERDIYVCPVCGDRFYDEGDCRNHIVLCDSGRFVELEGMLDRIVVNRHPDGRLNAVGYVSYYDPSYRTFEGLFMRMPWTGRDEFGTMRDIPLDGNEVVTKSEARTVYMETLDGYIFDLLSEVFGKEAGQ